VPAVHVEYAEYVVDLAGLAEGGRVEEPDYAGGGERQPDDERVSLSW
jgi:hypothetical protein